MPLIDMASRCIAYPTMDALIRVTNARVIRPDHQLRGEEKEAFRLRLPEIKQCFQGSLSFIRLFKSDLTLAPLGSH